MKTITITPKYDIGDILCAYDEKKKRKVLFPVTDIGVIITRDNTHRIYYHSELDICFNEFECTLKRKKNERTTKETD